MGSLLIEMVDGRVIELDADDVRVDYGALIVLRAAEEVTSTPASISSATPSGVTWSVAEGGSS
ncbi:hypothetical protein [Mycobacterium sp.]|uniref:hypothetical protein n=1 Tax=Mycobacterium sp. TaxID=1785 RepID=UPI003C7287DE